MFSIWALGECILTSGKALSIPFTPDVWSLWWCVINISSMVKLFLRAKFNIGLLSAGSITQLLSVSLYKTKE